MGWNRRKEVNKTKKYRKILQTVLIGIVLAIMLIPAIQGDINKQNEVNYNQPPTPPVADFHWTPTNPDVGEKITLNASDAYCQAGQRIVSYCWDLDEDGNCDDATGMITECCRHTADLYEVTLTIEDDRGLIGKKTKTIDFRHPPQTPAITGPRTGKIERTYTYNITTTDPDNDKVYYKIDWGPKTTDWLGPYTSGKIITQSYTWSHKGNYTIEVKAKDTTGAESDWATLEVSMPKNKVNSMPFLNFLQQHPHMFPLLQQLLGLQ